MISTSQAGSVEFEALVISLGPDFPIRITSWKYQGKTSSEWYDLFYEDEEPIRWNCVLRPGVDEKEAENIINTCNWIDTHIADFVNNQEDQSDLAENDRWDMGVFACNLKIQGYLTSTWDYTDDWEEELEFLKVVPADDLIKWDQILHREDK